MELSIYGGQNPAGLVAKLGDAADKAHLGWVGGRGRDLGLYPSLQKRSMMLFRTLVVGSDVERDQGDALMAIALLFAQSDDWDHMNGWGGGWMWLWGVAMMALFVVLLVWLIRGNAAGGSSGPAPRDPADRAREILAERYAKGELSTAEYRERIGELQ